MNPHTFTFCMIDGHLIVGFNLPVLPGSDMQVSWYINHCPSGTTTERRRLSTTDAKGILGHIPQAEIAAFTAWLRELTAVHTESPMAVITAWVKDDLTGAARCLQAAQQDIWRAQLAQATLDQFIVE